METVFKEVAKDVYVIALWDASCNSYINCYLIRSGKEIFLIDSGKMEQSNDLLKTLSDISISPHDVTNIFYTHGHHDHVGGNSFFPGAKKYIHASDLALIPVESRSDFSIDIVDEAEKKGIECIQIGHHSEGSALLYHRESKVMFCGDFVCFFGDPIPSDGLVSTSQEPREIAYQFYASMAMDPKMRQDSNFEPYDLFIHGLEMMRKFDSSVLCTGHGTVLSGDIPHFLDRLLFFSTEVINY